MGTDADILVDGGKNGGGGSACGNLILTACYFSP